MRYKFIECIFKNCGYDKTKWNKADASRIKSVFADGKMLTDLGFSKDKVNVSYFNKVKYFLDHYVYEADNGEKKLRGREYDGVTFDLDYHYNDGNEITYAECVFLCFVLKENGLFTGNLIELYGQLIKIAGIEYEIRRIENMRAAIFYYVLSNNKTVKEWRSLNRSWSEDKKEHVKKWYIEDCSRFTLTSLNLVLESGLEHPDSYEAEQESATQNSIIIINRIFNEINGCPENGQTIRDIFGNELIDHIENSEDRRRWYFLRITKHIVESQINVFYNEMRKYEKCQSETEKIQIRKKLIELEKQLWIKKRGQTWLDIAHNPEIVVKLAQKVGWAKIKEDLDNTTISIHRVFNCFNSCFEGVTYSVQDVLPDYKNSLREDEVRKVTIEAPPQAMAKYKTRLDRYSVYANRKGVEDADELFKIIYANEQIIDDVKSLTREGEAKLRDIYCGKGKKTITRQIILMIAILSFILLGNTGVSDENYIKNVLRNSRFDSRMNSTQFEIFIRNVLGRAKLESSFDKRLNILKEESRIMEIKYLKKGIAPFSEIFSRKEIE